MPVIITWICPLSSSRNLTKALWIYVDTLWVEGRSVIVDMGHMAIRQLWNAALFATSKLYKTLNHPVAHNIIHVRLPGHHKQWTPQLLSKHLPMKTLQPSIPCRPISVGHPSSASSPLLWPLQYCMVLHGDSPSNPARHSAPYTIYSVLGYAGGMTSLNQCGRLCVCHSSGCNPCHPF